MVLGLGQGLFDNYPKTISNSSRTTVSGQRRHSRVRTVWWLKFLKGKPSRNCVENKPDNTSTSFPNR